MDKEIKVKPSKSKKSPIRNNDWFKNVAKSAGHASVSVVKNMTPSSFEFVSDVVYDAANIVDDLKSGADSTIAGKVGSLFNNKYTGYAKQGIDNLVSDIKTGKLYNKDREEQMVLSGGDDDDFGDIDTDFSFGDMDVDISYEDDDGNEVEPSGINTITNVNANITKDNPMVKSINVQTEVIANSANATNRTNATIAASQMDTQISIANNTLTGISALNDNLSAIVNFQNDSMAKYVTSSLEFYKENLNLMQQSVAHLNTLAMVGAPQEVKRKERLDPFLSEGGLDISEYLKVVKVNVQNVLESNMITSQIMNMVSNDDFWTSIIANPLGTLMETGISTIIPNMVKESMARFDQTFASFFPALLGRFNNMGEDFEDGNPITRLIGQIFGFMPESKSSVNTSEYIKGDMRFNGITQKAITEVIPTYLRKILSAITGKNEMIFDYKNGKYQDLTKVITETKQNEENMIFNGMTSGIDMSDKLSAIRFANDADRKIFNDAFKDVMLKVYKTPGGVNPDDFTNKDGETVNQLRNLMSDKDVGIQNMILGIVDTLSNKEKMDMFRGSNIYDTKSRMAKYYTDIETNNSNAMYKDMLSMDHLSGYKKEDNGSYIIKKEGVVGGGADTVKTFDYIKDIRNMLMEGIVVFAHNLGSSTNDSTASGTIGGEASKLINKRTDKLKREKDKKAKADNDKRLKALNPHSKSFTLEEQIALKNNSAVTGISSIADLDSYSAEDISLLVNDRTNYIKVGEAENKKLTFNEKMSSKDNTIGRIFRGINSITDIPAKIISETLDRVDDTLYKLVFGNLGKDTLKGDTSFLAVILSTVTEKLGSFHEWTKENFFKPIHNSLLGENGLITKMLNSKFWESFKFNFGKGMNFMFGESDGNGRRGGLFSDIFNVFKDMGRGVRHIFTGKGYTDSNGKNIRDSNDSVFGSLKRTGSSLWGAFRGFLFGGDSGDGTKSEGFVSYMSSSFKMGVDNFKSMIFGENSVDRERTSSEFMSSMKAALPKTIASGIIGAGLFGLLNMKGMGLLGSLFLPGGPVGGAVIGMGVGLLSQSEKFKDIMFGKMDKDTNKRLGGIISPYLVNFFKANKIPIIGGATLGLVKNITGIGLLPSFMMPGGPIGGAIMGIGSSLILRSNAIQTALFGPEVDGKRIGGIIGKAFGKVNFNKLTAGNMMVGGLAGLGIGSFVNNLGIMGSFFLPGGPIGAAMLGIAGGLLVSSEKFKERVFGAAGEDGKRSGGLIDGFKNWASTNLLNPIRTKVEEFSLDTKEWFTKAIANPFSDAIDPIKVQIRNMIGDMKDMVTLGFEKFTTFMGESFEKHIGQPFGEFMEDKLLNPLKKFIGSIIGGSTKIFKTLLASPFKMLSVVTNSMVGSQQKRGKDKFVHDNVQNMFGLGDDGFSVKGSLSSMGNLMRPSKYKEAINGEFGASYFDEWSERREERDKEQDEHFASVRSKVNNNRFLDKLKNLFHRTFGYNVPYDHSVAKDLYARGGHKLKPKKRKELGMLLLTALKTGDSKELDKKYPRKKAFIKELPKDANKVDPMEELLGDRYANSDNIAKPSDIKSDSTVAANMIEDVTNNSIKNNLPKSVSSTVGAPSVDIAPESEGDSTISPTNVLDLDTVRAKRSKKESNKIKYKLGKVKASVVIGVDNIRNFIPRSSSDTDDDSSSSDDGEGESSISEEQSGQLKVSSGKSFSKTSSDTNNEGNSSVSSGKTKATAKSRGKKKVSNEAANIADIDNNASRYMKSKKSDKSLLARIAADVRIIAANVHGQLDGVGSNVFKTRKLLQKAFGVSDNDITGKSNKDRLGLFGRMKQAMFRPFAAIKDYFVDKMSVVVEKAINIGRAIGGMFAKLIEIPKAFINVGKSVLSTIGEVAKTVLVEFPSAMFSVVKTGMLIVGESFKALTPMVMKTLAGFGSMIGNTFKSVGLAMLGVGSVIKDTAIGFGEVLKGTLQATGHFIQKSLDGVTDLLFGTVKTAGTVLTTLATTSIETVGRVVSFGVEKFVDMGEVLFNGVKTVLKGTLDLVTSPFKFITSSIAKLVGIDTKEVIVKGGYLDGIRDIPEDSIKKSSNDKSDVSISNFATNGALNVNVTNDNLFGDKPLRVIIAGQDEDIRIMSKANKEQGLSNIQVDPSMRMPMVNPFLSALNTFDDEDDKEEDNKTSKAEKASEIAEQQAAVSTLTADNVKQRNALRADREKELSFKDKLLGAVQGMNTNMVQHSANWSDIFGKKGLITTAFLLGAPLIIDLLSKIFNKEINIPSVRDIVETIINLGDRGKDRTDENGEQVSNSNYKEALFDNVAKPISTLATKGGASTAEFLMKRAAKNGSQEVVEAGVESAVKNGAKAVGESTIKNAAKFKPGTGFLDRATDQLFTADAGDTKLITKFIDSAKGMIDDVLNSKPVVAILGSKAGDVMKFIAKHCDSLVKAISKAGGPMLSSVAAKISKAVTKDGVKLVPMAGWAVTGLFAAGDLASGFHDAANMMDVNKSHINFKMRTATAITKTIFGISALVDLLVEFIKIFLNMDIKKDVAELIYSFIATDKEEMELSKAQDLFKAEVAEFNKIHGTELSVDAYADKENKTLFQKTMDMGSNIWEGTKNLGSNIWEGTKNLGSNIWEGAKTVGKGAVDGAKWIGKTMWDSAEQLGGFAMDKAKPALDMFSMNLFNDDGVRDALGLNEDTKILMRDRLSLTMSNVIEAITLGNVKSEDTVKQIHGLYNTIIDKATGWWTSTRDSVTGFFSNLGDSIPEGLHNVNMWFGGLFNFQGENGEEISFTEGAKGVVDNTISTIVDNARTIRDETVRAWQKNSAHMKEVFANVGDNLKGAGTAFNNWMGGLFNFQDENGEPISFTQGASGVIDNTISTIVDNAKTIRDEVSRAWKVNSDHFKEFFGGIGNSLQKSLQSFDNWLGGLFDFQDENGKGVSFTEAAKGVKDRTIAGIHTVVTDIRKGFKDAWSNLGDKVSGILGNMKDGWNNFFGNISEGWNNFWDNMSNKSTENVNSRNNNNGGNGGFGESLNNFAYYSQNDPQYANEEYAPSNNSNSIKGVSNNIATRGCGPTAMAMVASQLTGREYDPVTMSNMAVEGNHSTSVGTTFGYFNDASSKVGIKSKESVTSEADIRSSLGKGQPVILRGRSNGDPSSPFTSSGHYVVGVKSEGNKVLVNDPRGPQYSRNYNMDELVSQSNRMWSFDQGGYGEDSPLELMIKHAMSKVGKPYIWGSEGMIDWDKDGENKDGYDCSGLVSYAMHHAGIPMGRGTAQSLYGKVDHLRKSQIQRGDLGFVREAGKATHIGIYLGDGKWVESIGDKGVMETSTNSSKWNAYGRIKQNVLGTGVASPILESGGNSSISSGSSNAPKEKNAFDMMRDVGGFLTKAVGSTMNTALMGGEYQSMNFSEYLDGNNIGEGSSSVSGGMVYNGDIADTNGKFNPNVTAAQINKALSGALKGKGQSIINAARKYNVDPILAASIMIHETGHGTSRFVRELNNPAGVMDWDNNWKTGRKFPTLDAGIDYAVMNLNKNYISKGLTSIPQIGAKYAPVGASNDPNGLNKNWPSGISKFYNQMSGEQGGMGGQIEPVTQITSTSNSLMNTIDNRTRASVEDKYHMETLLSPNKTSNSSGGNMESLVEKVIMILTKMLDSSNVSKDKIVDAINRMGNNTMMGLKSVNTSNNTIVTSTGTPVNVSGGKKTSMDELVADAIASGRFN